MGSHTISAAYSGDINYAPSSSANLTQKVTYAVKALYDQTKATNSGAGVPVKVELNNAIGTNVSSSGIVVTIAGLSPSPAPGTPPSGNFTFTIFSTGPGYIDNVKTTGYPNNTYTLYLAVTGDPVTHTVQFVVG